MLDMWSIGICNPALGVTDLRVRDVGGKVKGIQQLILESTWEDAVDIPFLFCLSFM